MFRNIFLVSILLLVLAGCRESQHGNHSDSTVQISLDFVSQAVSETELIITLKDADNNAINDATISVKGDMDHAGMQPVLAEIENGTDGVYTAPFEWTMAGDWIVEVDVTLPDGTTASQTFNYTIATEGTVTDTSGDATEEAGMAGMDHSNMDMSGDTTEEPAMAGMDHSNMNMGGGSVSAAYMVIVNTGDSDDSLIAVETDAAESVEIHETVITENDVMQMNPLEDGAAIPAGETTMFEPGGIHIMLINLQQDLVAGETVPLKLIFASGAEVEIEAVIQDEAPSDVTIEADTLTIQNPWVRPMNR